MMTMFRLCRLCILIGMIAYGSSSALALDCSFIVASPGLFTFPSSGGSGFVSVSAGPGFTCSYSITGVSGPAIQSVGFAGPGGFSFIAAANPGPSSISGTITVATNQASSGVNVIVVSPSAIEALTTAVNPVANTMDVEYVGGNAHVIQLWYNGVWNKTDLSALTGAPNASLTGGIKTIFNSLGNSMEVHYIGADQHIHTLSYNGTWHHTDLTTTTGAPNAASNAAVTASMDPIANTEEVEYIGTDHHVHQLWYNGLWHAQDLTSASGAAPNADSSSGIHTLMNTIGNAMEVHYIGTDHHLYSLWYNGLWHSVDHTTLEGAPLAVAGSPLTSAMDPIANTEELEYITPDHHVYQLWYNGLWHPNDLMIASGAAPNADSSSGIHTLMNAIGNAMEVQYIGTDHHVYALWYNGLWHSVDHTTLEGAPIAIAGSPLTSAADTVANTIDLEYIGSNQHVYQLWYNGLWHVTDLTATVGP